MKQLKCEMCGGTDLIKDNGIFVCQSCSCKYTVEEARKLMIDGKIELTGTIKVDHSEQVDNYLILSRNAYSSGNGQSALVYANKALEISPDNSQAWICKMKAIEHISTLGNLRLIEVVEAGKNAINSATPEEKSNIEFVVYNYELLRALSLLKLAMNKMLDSADVKQTYQRLLIVNVLTAARNTFQMDKKIVNIYDNIANEAIAMVQMIPNESLVRHKELIRIINECAKQYQYETNALVERYKIYDVKLNNDAVAIRKNKKRSLEDKASKIMNICEEIDKAERIAATEKRINEYWEKHADLKQKLEQEKISLEEKVSIINSKKNKISGLDEQKSLNHNISELKHKKNSLGIFNGKEKKEIQAQIDSLNQRLTQISEKIDNEKNEMEMVIVELKNRISKIDRELTKER